MKSQNMNIQDFLVDYGERLTPEEVKSAQKYKTVKDLLQGFADKKETSIKLFDVSVFFGAEDDWDYTVLDILQMLDEAEGGKYQDIIKDLRVTELGIGPKDAYKEACDRVSRWIDENDSDEAEDIHVSFWDDDPCPDKLFVWVYHVAHGFDLQDLYEYFMGFEVSEEMLPDLASRLLA